MAKTSLRPPTDRLLTLALGANQGDSIATLAAARAAICDRIGPIRQASAVHRTAAWGVTHQPDFYNQVIVVALPACPTPPLHRWLHRLLDTTQQIEQALGLDRSQKKHWGPRPCDIDIIFVGDIRYEDERISLPHPWWAARDFVGGILQRELADWLPFPGQY